MHLFGKPIFSAMTVQSPLRDFFEQELRTSHNGGQTSASDTRVPTSHLVSHLVERTVHRAALDAATHRHASGSSSETPAPDVSWKRCLLVAALTELRPVLLSAN
jgi:hypothetical protein